MTTPTIHLNGTAASDLAQGYENAYRAISAAIEAVQESSPNARDYYVQGPSAFAAARTEHETRMHRLADTARELLALYDAVSQ